MMTTNQWKPRVTYLFIFALLVLTSKVTLAKRKRQAKSSKRLNRLKKDVSMVEIKGDTFVMGNPEYDKRNKEDIKQQQVSVDDFFIDKVAVTNDMFRSYYRKMKKAGKWNKTEAEVYGWSFVLDFELPKALKKQKLESVPQAKHWKMVPGSYWRRPYGKGSSISKTLDHPVLHISWNDAQNYCKSLGKRLPTETEWEYAARGGLDFRKYPWGNMQPYEGDNWKFNIWQGEFPNKPSTDDGYLSTCPSESFIPNGYGLYNMVGNVWEWTSTEFEHDPSRKVLRGGSFLDSLDGAFNHKATVVTRMGNTPDSSSTNTGFRCAASKFQKRLHKGYVHRKKGGNGLPQGMSQEDIQKIVAEKGADGLKEILAASGSNAQVMTPKELTKRQEILKQQRRDLQECLLLESEFEQEDCINDIRDGVKFEL